MTGEVKLSGRSGRDAHRGIPAAANTPNADGVPWIAPALAPKRKTREASLRAERDYLAYSLEGVQAQVNLLERLSGRSIETMIQSYRRMARRDR